MTLIELCIVVVILGILMVVGVASLLRARLSSNESSAVGSLRAIYSAQFSYTAGCGQGYYATTLLALTRPGPSSREGYLSPDLGGSNTPQRNGYRFGLGPGRDANPGAPDCNREATQTRYYAFTVPLALGNTGERSFAMTQRGEVLEAMGGTPPPEPAEPAK